MYLVSRLLPAHLLIASILFGQCALTRKASNPGLRLSTRMESEAAIVGEPAVVHILLANLAKSAFTLMERFEERDFEALVTDSRGEPPPLTEYGGKIRASPYGVSLMHYSSLPPGQSVAGDEDLTRIYKLAPGKYSVSVCRIVVDVGAVYSKEVHFVVKGN